MSIPSLLFEEGAKCEKPSGRARVASVIKSSRSNSFSSTVNSRQFRIFTGTVEIFARQKPFKIHVKDVKRIRILTGQFCCAHNSPLTK